MKRIEEIDITKGILIILVVVGHAQLSEEYKNLIYWFHMPLFFFISGFLISKSRIRGEGALKYLIKKMLKLLVPYFSFMLFVTVLSVLMGVGESTVLSHEFLARAILGGKFLVNQFGVFWFITCLAGTILLFALIERYVANKMLKILLVTTLFLLGHLESYFIQNGINIFAPYNVDTALVTLTYFYIGTEFKSLLTASTFNTFKKTRILFYALVSLSLITIFLFFNFLTLQSLDLKYQIYHNPLLTLLVPINFGILVAGLSSILNRLKITNLLTEFGRHSLTIMYLHLFIRAFLSDYNFYHNISFTLLGLFLPLFISLLFQKNDYTSFFFLGDSKYLDDNLPNYIFKKYKSKYLSGSQYATTENKSKKT